MEPFKFEIDPVANLLPEMSEEEFQGLKLDIETNGQKEPIIQDMSTGRILDGRHRLRACNELGIPPYVERKEVDDPLQFVLSLNVHRRHLNESQRAMIAAKLNKESSGKGRLTINRAAEMMNISRTSVTRALKVSKGSIPGVLDAINAGSVAASDASRIAHLDDDHQEKALKRVLLGQSKTLKSASRRIRLEEAEPEVEPVVEEQGPTTLYHMSCKELTEELEPESVDVIFTDPPYHIRYLSCYEDLIQLADKVLKPGGSLLTMTGQVNLPKVLNAMDTSAAVTYMWTFAYVFEGGSFRNSIPGRSINIVEWKPVSWHCKRPYTGRRLRDLFTSSQLPEKYHKWSQSESGVLAVMRKFVTPQSVVLDPFVGGGTMAIVAARELGANFIGADISEEAVETTRSRLMQSDFVGA